jgi:molybdopterin-guanine dinucleotide biosynthesis protein A
VKASSCAALLLAGGASTRMGFPKALADVEGKPLWRTQIEKLAALLPAELFFSAPEGLELPAGTWTLIRDEKTGLGPLAGLAAAHRIMSAGWLIVLAIDLPRMTASYLETLRGRAFTSGLGQVPELDGRYLGLAAIYPRAFLDRHLDAHLRSDDRSVQRLVRAGIAEGSLASCPVAENERHLFQNVNTPEDLSASGGPGYLLPGHA